MSFICSCRKDFEQIVTNVFKIRLVPKPSEFLAADEWHVDVVQQGEDGEETVRIGKDLEKNIDYLLHENTEVQAFENRLRDQLHLRPRETSDGADEFSV